ncbi:hypothetical protein [Cytobacillus massiliigabonensis]|uniref:hypothetical protein n=1 Tax=Cytobacillus massiliigabonensis TaxID=1871011 RepID=UPI000C84EE57|nr:hypothetical protein [Cytobacillus massiliigabonensis]
MIFINDELVTNETDPIEVEQIVKKYLVREKLVLVDKEGQPLGPEEQAELLSETLSDHYFEAVHTSILLRDFRAELQLYIKKVDEYIENTRDKEDFSTVNVSFVQVIEALMEFSSVSTFLHKDLMDPIVLTSITEKAFKQMEMGNLEYLLDLMEYELLPVLNEFVDEINEEM